MRLYGLHLLSRSQVDRHFRPPTVRAVKRFQRQLRLRPTGRVNLRTWNLVASELKRRTAPRPRPVAHAPAPPAPEQQMIDWCDKCEEMMQPFLDGSLSEAEVEALLEAPDVATAQGLRDRAPEVVRARGGNHVHRVGRGQHVEGPRRQGAGDQLDGAISAFGLLLSMNGIG